MRAEQTIEIQRPVEQVFNYVADARNLQEWAGAVVEVKEAPARPLQDGDTYVAVGKFLGRTIETTYRARVTAPHQLVMEATGGPIPHSFIMTFAPHGVGTQVTNVWEGEPGTFFRLAGPLFERAAGRQAANDLATMKDILEQ